MFRATLKHLAARKLRLLSTGIAVILGVAFMAGTLVLTDTIGRTFDNLFADVNAGVDAYVRSDQVVEGEMDDHRQRLDAGIVTTVTEVDGVAAAEGTVQGYAQILDADGDAIGGGENAPPTYGGNWIATEALNPFELADGRAPAATGEVVIDKASADEAGYAIGDTTTVLTQAGPTSAVIVGIATFGGADSPGGASFALFTMEDAQRLIAEPGHVDAVRVTAGDGVSEATLAERVAAVVPTGVEVLTGAEITAEDQDDIAEGLSFFNTFLLTFALIALFVGSFIIYNTFSILVAQRGRETALLRAIGASRRQVLGSVLGEAVAVGVVSSAIGVVAGIGVAGLLKAVLAGAGIDIPAGDLVVTTDTVVISAVVGLVVSVASAVLPARRASKVAPVAAMRDTALDANDGSRRRFVIGAAVGVVGAALLASGLFAGAGISAVGMGIALVFVAVAALGPVLARPITRALGAPIARFRGLPGTLARENAMRNPRRTSATAAALMVGVALVGTITVLASSAKTSIDHAIDEAFSGDVAVQSGSYGFGGFSPQLAADIEALPEIDAVTSLRITTVEVEGKGVEIYGVDTRRVTEIFDLGAVEGSLADLGADEIALHADHAADEGLTLGDTVEVRFADTGVQALTVAALYEEDDAAGDYVLGLPAYEANVADQFDSQIYASAADGVTVAQAKAAVDDLAAAYPQAEVQDGDEFAESAGAQLDQMLNLMYALLFLAILIALIGIANTLVLSIVERTRELGLLRAVGMTRRQLRATVRWESVLVALLGATMGLVVGTGFGWALVKALEDEGITMFTIPAGQLLVIATLAGLAGVVAAIMPARRAARLDVLAAIATT